MGIRRCLRCEKEKPSRQFERIGSFTFYCSSCLDQLDGTVKMEERQKEPLDPDTRRKRYEAWIFQEYRLTHEKFSALLLKQEGRCGICREPLKLDRDTHVDHDHETGEVRGLLCSSCNCGLGFFRDDQQVLLKATEYLKNPPAIGILR